MHLIPKHVLNIQKKMKPTVDAVSSKIKHTQMGMAQKIDAKVNATKQWVDAGTSHGTADRCLDASMNVLENVLRAPMKVSASLNVAYANVCGSRYLREAQKTEDGAYKLYRGITQTELRLLLHEQEGSFFEQPVNKTDVSWRHVLQHVIGSYEQDTDRVLTSFSTKKELAYKFANTHQRFGVLVAYTIPKAVVENFGWFGMNIHREVLLPTSMIDRSTAAFFEVRGTEELKEARGRELTAAVIQDPTGFAMSHAFVTDPMMVCDLHDNVQLQQVTARIQALMADQT